jgi:2-polyprenyl-6-methoxyphenol hydroxylase-like FAD-dependent oxidoreductase
MAKLTPSLLSMPPRPEGETPVLTLRIAVIGAGIGGLVAAAGLQSDGHDVTVYEQRPDPSPSGAGLTLFGNAFAALDALRLGDVVRDISSGTIATLRAGQRHPSGSWLITVPPSAVASMRSVHRVALHQTLADRLHPGTVRTGCSALVAGDGAPAVMVGDATEDYDLVVVADGIRSRNRAALGLDTGLRYAGYTAWRGVTARPLDLRGAAGETWGRGQIFGVVPLPDDRVYWFGTMTTPEGTAFPDEYEAVRQRFMGWHEPIQACIEATPPERVMRHDIYDLARPLASFARGRTVLLGDAAHAMTPNLGQGAGQAIEDAATLALLLRGAGTTGLDAALARYSTLRQKRTKTLMLRSRMAGRVAQASGPMVIGLRDTALRLTPGAVMGALSRRLAAWSEPVEKRTADNA